MQVRRWVGVVRSRAAATARPSAATRPCRAPHSEQMPGVLPRTWCTLPAACRPAAWPRDSRTPGRGRWRRLRSPPGCIPGAPPAPAAARQRDSAAQSRRSDDSGRHRALYPKHQVTASAVRRPTHLCALQGQAGKGALLGADQRSVHGACNEGKGSHCLVNTRAPARRTAHLCARWRRQLGDPGGQALHVSGAVATHPQPAAVGRPHARRWSRGH